MRSHPLPPDGGDTRQVILGTAREMLQTRSYLGLNFQELADRVGIRKASLYHHFPSKEALAIAVIEQSTRWFVQWQERQRGLSPARQLLAYIRMFRDHVGAGARVCPGGALSSEWDCIEPELRAAAQRMHREHWAWLTAAALPLQPDDETAARQWAAQVNAICQGALLTARTQGSVDYFDLATAPLVAQLERLG